MRKLCTDNGEILIKNAIRLVSFNPENNQNIFAIEDAHCANYTANSIESLVLLDGGKSVSDTKLKRGESITKPLLPQVKKLHTTPKNRRNIAFITYPCFGLSKMVSRNV